MKILAFDSIGGAAGDMILASLIDLGVDAGGLNRDLAALNIGSFHIRPEAHSAAGIHGLRLRIELTDARPSGAADTGGHAHPAHAGAHGRGWREIRALIEASGLPEPVKADSIAVFAKLAEAEARVHRCEPDEIHFHEVGAVDSIIDIVGCCLARYRLGADRVFAGPLPLGNGTVTCAHGVLPVPAPATLELLRGFPVRHTDEPFELVTPTGAAILTEWHCAEARPATCRIQRSGHGFGSRALCGRPNLLRATIMTADDAGKSGALVEDCVELACNLDDMPPELIGPLVPRLLEAGALDAYLTAVQMKKQRPGCLLTVLCRPEDRARLTDLVFSETTTFGVRWRASERERLERRHVEVPTPFGPAAVKIGIRAGTITVRSPEYEDCRRLAAQHHVPIREVYQAVLTAARECQ